MNSIALILFAALSIGHIMATDYCSSSICPTGTSHIACGHSGKFDSTCPKDAAIVTLTTAMKNAIVNRHNAKRNLVAGGKAANHKPACRMATMKWNAELAKLAALNVRQCKMNHDSCRNTDAFKYSGQNLAWRTYSGTLDTQKMLVACVDMWYNEVKYSNMSNIKAFPVTYDHNKEFGHFTVMVVDRNIAVGCAVAKYTKDGAKNFLMGCNYATTNMQTKPIYASCTKPATSCKKGKNTKYPNLCSPQEVYSVNKW
ncbi:antigen 5 like allergen Cul n 1-like [Haematobia irritans]|uniref:antigen 5 like allergen Cul n 1-like n=1 Tax=Haematobia irritans TaxID=7368 RepID=UPI003F50111F